MKFRTLTCLTLGCLSLLISNQIYSQTAKLFGTGIRSGGTIFSLGIDGSYQQVLVDMRFGDNSPFQQSRLIGKDGKLYGMTSQGVSSRYGVIYSINPDGSDFTVIYEFSGADGIRPESSLIDANGMFYGTTRLGGDNNGGIVFRINYDGTGYEVLHMFQGNLEDGQSPRGDLYEFNGLLWGVTELGGINHNGVLYSINLQNGIYSKIYDFGNSDASHPSGSVIVVNGDLWGLSTIGGANNVGCMYRISLADTTFAKIYDFEQAKRPVGALLADNGFLWGSTSEGGVGGAGTIFRIKDDGSNLEIIHEFNSETVGSENNVGNVLGSLISRNERIWGLAPGLGGGVFSVNNNGFDFQVHQRFDQVLPGGAPVGTLTFWNNSFFGLTNNGGSGGTGTVFKIDDDGNGFEVIHSFGETIGSAPIGQLVELNGKLFGVARDGGVGYGVIYSMDTDGSDYSKIYQFKWDDYNLPQEDLLVHEGMLYGVTSSGGANDKGGIFRVNPDGSGFSVIRDLMPLETQARITTVVGNQLWGTLKSGDINNRIIFNVDVSGENFQRVHDFMTSEGTFLPARLLLWEEKLYGTAYYGGDTFDGVIFSLRIDNGEYEILHHFDGANGRNPRSELIEFNGWLWGTTQKGGIENKGTIFRIDSVGNFEILHSFSDDDGTIPYSGLIEHAGVLYGTTTEGGGGYGSIYQIDAETLEFTKITAFTPDFGGRPFSTPIVIVKTDQEIEFDLIDELKYGDNPIELNASSSSSNPILFNSSDENVLSVDGALATIKQPGEITLSAFQSATEHFHEAYAQQDIVVGKAELFAKANDQQITYGDELPTLDITYEGFVFEDGVMDINQPDISTSATSTSDAGVYEILLTGGSATNYTISLQDGLLTIAKAGQEITFDELESISTDQRDVTFVGESTSGLTVTFESSDEDILTIENQTGTVIGHGTVTVTASQNGDQNFLAADPVKRTLIINRVLGLNEGSEIVIYPNPFVEQFQLPKISGKRPEILLMDASGIAIPFDIIDKNTTWVVKTRNLTPGVYFLKYIDRKTNSYRMIKSSK